MLIYFKVVFFMLSVYLYERLGDVALTAATLVAIVAIPALKEKWLLTFRKIE